MLKSEIIAKLESRNDRSAWDKAVTIYAIELLDDVSELNGTLAEKKATLLNGADDWNQYSEGGCALVCDCDIAERVCTPSKLKKTRGGETNPNSRESWIDVQARALYQACNRICQIVRRWESAEGGNGC